MADSLLLELADFEHMVHTGIYSEETGRPQPLRFSVTVRMKPIAHYDADTSLDASKNYMDLKFACSEALDGGTHFKLIEAVADHVAALHLPAEAGGRLAEQLADRQRRHPHGVNRQHQEAAVGVEQPAAIRQQRRQMLLQPPHLSLWPAPELGRVE